MTAFLTPEWVEELNAALRDLPLPADDPADGLVARDGTFTVVEEIRHGPQGDVRLVLRADHGAVRLELLPSELPGGSEASERSEGSERVDVTLVLDHDDAAALADGRLTPAIALTEGRVKVRGDLGVLVAAQRLLAAAHEVVARRPPG